MKMTSCLVTMVSPDLSLWSLEVKLDGLADERATWLFAQLKMFVREVLQPSHADVGFIQLLGE